MKRFEPYVFLRDLASRWDVLAFIVVIGLIVFLGETSRGLFAPLSQLNTTPLSLDPIASARVRGTHHVSHAGGAVALAGVHPDLRHLGGQERAGRQAAGTHPGYPAIGADSGFHFRDGGVLHVAGARPGARRRIRRDLRHIHQPGLEHGIQLLSVPAHDSDRTHRKRRSRSGCRRGCASGSWRCRSACRRSSGT